MFDVYGLYYTLFYWENFCLFRHKLIKSLITQSHEGKIDTILSIWEPLTTQVISLVGETGFNSLYVRSIYLTQKNCPWCAFSSKLPQASELLIELKMNFERLSSAQYNEANSLLLITFTDILASLIGEQLTLRILHSAWSKQISGLVGREHDDE